MSRYRRISDKCWHIWGGTVAYVTSVAIYVEVLSHIWKVLPYVWKYCRICDKRCHIRGRTAANVTKPVFSTHINSMHSLVVSQIAAHPCSLSQNWHNLPVGCCERMSVKSVDNSLLLYKIWYEKQIQLWINTLYIRFYEHYQVEKCIFQDRVFDSPYFE